MEQTPGFRSETDDPIDKKVNTDYQQPNDDAMHYSMGNKTMQVVVGDKSDGVSTEGRAGTSIMKVLPETHAFAMEIAKKQLNPETISGIKENIAILEQLEERSLGYRKYNNELTAYEAGISDYLKQMHSINADRLTVEEASDLITFINDGYNEFDMPSTPEERLEVTRKSEEIKEKKVEFLQNAVHFAINGVHRRRDLLPEIDKLMDKCSRSYEKSLSGYDLDEALGDDAIDLPGIDEYGDYLGFRGDSYYGDDGYGDDDYGYNYGQPVDRGDRKNFYRGRLRERLEEIDSSELEEFIDVDYKYRYGAFTNNDIRDLDDVSNLVYDDYIRKNNDVGVAEFVDEIAFAPVRSSTTESNMVKLYVAEKYYPSRILSRDNLAQLAIAINKELGSGKIDKDVSKARGVERAINKALGKQNTNASEISFGTLSKDFDDAIELIIERVSSGELIIEDREEFYDQIETILRSGFRNDEEYIAKFERFLEEASGEEIADCIADVGLSRAAYKLKVGIGHMNKYLNRLYGIQADNNSGRPIGGDFVDELAKKINDGNLHNRSLETWEIKDLSSVDYQIKHAENRFVLINALLEDSNQETDASSRQNIALLEDALKGLDF